MTVMSATRAAVRDLSPLHAGTPQPRSVPMNFFVDPLDDDVSSDEEVVTTRRAISRVALVATETAARFQREGVLHDPMTWMLSPRVLFAGASALDACLDRESCLRGVLLHGLSLGLDADPAAIDELAAEDREEEVDLDEVGSGEAGGGRRGIGDFAGKTRAPLPDSQDGEPRLFTATVVASNGLETVQAFHASIATEEAEVAGRLYMRMGAAMADAVIVEGLDPNAPLVAALVAPALCDTLALVAADPGSPLACGLDLNVEQRFLG